MSTLYTSAEVHRAVELLASRPLVRLVTEIDDNGAVPPRRLAGVLPDLSTRQLRSASGTARAHGLVRVAPGAGLELTDAGMELADLYDAMARWARRHTVPAPVCEFSSRIRHVLDLLAPSLTAERADRPSPLISGGTEAGLARPRTLLIQWLAENPQVTRVSEPEPVA
ncbi:regulator [Streptomyces sp. SPB162]|uniref:regulator n=1 Tax=Streptomyces sp. SPB162 TaxID=2940560 RepID=UPI002404974F|nr:regulator [Streptomyces sp. SPB162]MDF9811797.1 DNA-binding HxlR family transcriptional regulator [Streptomyces sp. SPB162]